MKRKSVLAASAALAAAVLLSIGSVSLAEPKAYDYLIPEADTRVYTPDEIGIMSLQVTNYAKNEIYARHGRKFNSKELTAYFSEQPWYEGTVSPSAFDESVLNNNELANIELLAKREKELTWDGKGYQLDQAGWNTEEITGFLSDDYNILEGLDIYATSGTAVMDAEHFTLTAPAKPGWAYLQLNRYVFEIYYPPAEKGGFGGHIVSIAAYEFDDKSYEEAPHYAEIGEGQRKRFIAFYPTDVQFDPQDPKQAEEYGALFEWAQTMDSGNSSSPFSVTDPEPPEDGGSGAEAADDGAGGGENAGEAEETEEVFG